MSWGRDGRNLALIPRSSGLSTDKEKRRKSVAWMEAAESAGVWKGPVQESKPSPMSKKVTAATC